MTYTAKQLPTDQIYASTFQPILYIQNIDSTKMRMLTLKNAWFSASSSLPKEKKVWPTNFLSNTHFCRSPSNDRATELRRFSWCNTVCASLWWLASSLNRDRFQGDLT